MNMLTDSGSHVNIYEVDLQVKQTIVLNLDTDERVQMFSYEAQTRVQSFVINRKAKEKREGKGKEGERNNFYI